MGMDLAPLLGKVTKEHGDHIEVDGGRIKVAWCAGHIISLHYPPHYTGTKKWDFANLPVLPERFEYTVDKGNLYRLIVSLAKNANVIVNCGDPDREGQLLVDEVFIHAGMNPASAKFKRAWLSSMSEEKVRKEIANLRTNASFQPLRLAAFTRQISDWVVGMNYTMAVSIAAGSTCHLGRVKTPTLALIVRRDLEIENFRPHDYFVPWVMVRGIKFTFAKCHQAIDVFDEEGRLINREFAEKVAEHCKTAVYQVTRCDSEVNSVSPPLPHSLDSLQILLSRTHNMSAEETLAACQALYLPHKIATYPRTDCRYLPKEMLAERGNILKSLYETYPQEISLCNPAVISKCFNDAKVTAHHAIIPTGKKPDLSALSAHERAAFDAICRFYIAQSCKDALVEKEAVAIEYSGGLEFTAYESTVLEANCLSWENLLTRKKTATKATNYENFFGFWRPAS